MLLPAIRTGTTVAFYILKPGASSEVFDNLSWNRLRCGSCKGRSGGAEWKGGKL